jgi:hypothetical protein
MNQSANLTPPTKTKAAPPAAAKTGNAAPKAEKAPADPNAPKKPRAARQDYGFSPDATIVLVAEKASKYRGQRADWYKRISEFSGKKVSEFMTKYEDAKTPKGSDDPPRGWVRFFVQDGSITLNKPAAPTQTTFGSPPAAS